VKGDKKIRKGWSRQFVIVKLMRKTMVSSLIGSSRWWLYVAAFSEDEKGRAVEYKKKIRVFEV